MEQSFVKLQENFATSVHENLSIPRLNHFKYTCTIKFVNTLLQNLGKFINVCANRLNDSQCISFPGYQLSPPRHHVDVSKSMAINNNITHPTQRGNHSHDSMPIVAIHPHPAPYQILTSTTESVTRSLVLILIIALVLSTLILTQWRIKCPCTIHSSIK